MKKTMIIQTMAAICSLAAMAEIPQGYYSPLDGKSGDGLSAAVTALSAGHVRVTYNTKTWPAFETTDVRTVNGRKAWRDMYSNNLVYLPGHDALNIEHSVANSWWGGKSGDVDAYSDLFHLNPSDQNANNKKGNYPPGKVADARLLDNGLMLIGTPVSGQGGGATSVFEPSDEYKGDFARAYFYVFTAYPEAPWKEEYAYVYGNDGKLSPWAVELLLDWHRSDPVDTEEMERNEAVYALQKNRNPFIDYPSLAEYLWGDMVSHAFSLIEEHPVQAADRPAAPVFADTWMTGVNTYSLRWWNGFTQRLEHDGEGTLMVSIDGRDYYPSQGMIDIDPAETHMEKHVYSAYVVKEIAGMELRSPVARLTAVARDLAAADYSNGVWEKMTSTSGMNLEEGPFLLLSSNTLHTMGVAGGTSATAFMESAGFVEFNAEGHVTQLPVDAAMVRFESVGNDRYRLSVSDVSDTYKGSWNATAKNKMKLAPSTYTAATAVVGQNDEFIFTFEEFGSLQFNKSQPRFLNYETSQTPVYLYRFTGFGEDTGIDSVTQDTPWAVGIDSDGITVPDGIAIYDLSGRRVAGRGLRHGVYIVTDGRRSEKVMF